MAWHGVAPRYGSIVRCPASGRARRRPLGPGKDALSTLPTDARKETPRTNVPKWQRTPETPFAAFCDAKSSETTAPFSFYFNLPLRTTVVNANRLLVWKCLVTHLRRGRILEAKNLLDLLLRAAAACN